jgi:hypothetical protein
MTAETRLPERFSSASYKAAAASSPRGPDPVQGLIRRDFLQPHDPGLRAAAEKALSRDALGGYQATLLHSDPIRARCAAKYGISLDDLVGPLC